MPLLTVVSRWTWPLATFCLCGLLAAATPAALAQAPRPTQVQRPAPLQRAAQPRLQPQQSLAALIQEAAELSKTATAGEDLARLITLCKQAQAQNPPEPHATYFRELEAWSRSRRGELYAEQANLATDDTIWQKYEQAAFQDFDLAVQQNPKLWQAVHHRAVSHARLGRIDEAIADLDTTLQMNPKFNTGWYNRAELHYQQRDFKQALADYEAALKLDATDVDAVTGKAHTLYQLEKYREALTHYSQAVKIAPQDASRYADRADAYSDLGFWEQATGDFSQALDLDADLARAYQGVAWILATCPDEKYRDPEQAVELAERAIQLNPAADYRYHDTLAAAQAAIGKFDIAVKSGETAAQQAPETERTYIEHRLALYQQRKAYLEPSR
ncbi:MAG: tetratricopeptide repeat protein [Pirellulaceae bacterium]